MNPDLYACLPPAMKEEYQKLFPEPDVDQIIIPKWNLDDRITNGYALFYRTRFYRDRK